MSCTHHSASQQEGISHRLTLKLAPMQKRRHGWHWPGPPWNAAITQLHQWWREPNQPPPLPSLIVAQTTSLKQPYVPVMPAGSNAAILMGSVKGGSHPQWEVRKPNSELQRAAFSSSIRGSLQPDICKPGCSLPELGWGGFYKSNIS